MKQTDRFRHEAFHSPRETADVLKALTAAFAKGHLVLEDGDDQMTLDPQGLVRLKLSAEQEDGHNKLTIRLSWTDDTPNEKSKPLKIKS